MSSALKLARVILSDAGGLAAVCGPLVAMRWMTKIAKNLGSCRRDGSLQPADMAMGPGPYLCRHSSGAQASIGGPEAIGGIREMWVRDVYFKGGFLELPKKGVVVDLGSNMGNFTLLSLAAGPGVRTVSVEPDRKYTEGLLKEQLERNGWTSRATVVNAFVGGMIDIQDEIAHRPTGVGVPTISEAELMKRGGLADGEPIELIKCDIEGSEFELLRPGSRLLAAARQLTMEVHTNIGDAPKFYKGLEQAGFEVRIARKSSNDEIIHARRPGS